MEKKRSLGHGKKSIEKILLIPDVSKLLTLCDGNLDVLNLYNLEPTTPIGPASKGVTTFCIKKNSPDYRLCILSKRKLSFFEYVGVFELYKEVVLPDSPITLEWCQNTLCLGYRKEYAILDIDNEFHRVLFPLDRTLPRTKLLPESGKLLLTTEDVSVAINLLGEPVQGALQWSSNPISFAYYEPYLVTLLQNKTIEIHDTFNERLVQAFTKLPHPSPPFMFHAISEGRGNGKDLLVLYSSGPNTVYCLNLGNPDGLIQELISSGNSEDAIRMFEIFFKRERASISYEDSYDSEQEKLIHRQRLAKIYEQIGLNDFYKFQYSSAFKYLNQSQIDPRSIIAFYPSYLPYQTNFRSSSASATEDIFQLIERYQHQQQLDDTKKLELIQESKLQLTHYLESKCTVAKADEQKDIVTVLIKLYSEFNNRDKLIQLLRKSYQFFLQDVEEWLNSRKLYSNLGIIYQFTEKYRKALLLWLKLSNGELKDTHQSDGIEESISLLEGGDSGTAVVNNNNNLVNNNVGPNLEPPKELIWEFAPYLISNYPDRAIRIFLKHRKDPLPVDEVLEFLQPYGTKLYQRFLEFIIFEEGNRTEYLHTRLASSYIDTIFNISPEFNNSNNSNNSNNNSTTTNCIIPEPTPERHKLIDLLEFSNCYNASALLHRLRNSVLYEELVILYLRLSQYEMMFNIIVWKLKDFAKAEYICSTFDPKISLSAVTNNSLSSSGSNTPILSSQNHNNTANNNPPSNVSPIFTRHSKTSPSMLPSTSPLPGTSPSVFNRQQPQQPFEPSTSFSSLASSSTSSLASFTLPKEGLYDPKRQELFLCLLKTYLNFKNYQTQQQPQQQQQQSQPIIPNYIIEFLNNYYFEMDPIKVIQILPSNIPIQLLGGYLSKAFTFSISNQRESKIVKNLHKAQNLQVKYQHMKVCSGSVHMTSDKRCPVCSKVIGDRVFAYFPNGVVVHFKCFQISNICPITAQNFKLNPIEFPLSV
eukprot:gene685-846_t